MVLRFGAALLLALVLLPGWASAGSIVGVSVTGAVHADRRAYLQQLVFGSRISTAWLPTSTAADQASVWSGETADLKWTVAMPESATSYCWFHSTSSSAPELTIIHQGHDVWDDGVGFAELAAAIELAGSDLLLLEMPGMGANTWSLGHGPPTTAGHNQVSTLVGPTGFPTALYPFLYPVAACLNQAISNRSGDPYAQIGCTGLSGGGGTCTLLAALDSRIDISVDNSGSLPWSLRTTHYGDYEWSTTLWNIAPYEELYVMSADAAGRARCDHKNQNDSCCFARTGAKGAYGADFGDQIAKWDAEAAGSITWTEANDPGFHRIGVALRAATLSCLGL